MCKEWVVGAVSGTLFVDGERRDSKQASKTDRERESGEGGREERGAERRRGRECKEGGRCRQGNKDAARSRR